MRLYLAGPMTGKPSLNFPAFMDAAAKLRAAGYEVFNPAEKDLASGFNPDTDTPMSLAEYMEDDLPELCRCDGLALMDGWHDSKGARLEAHTAQTLDIQSYTVDNWIHDACLWLAPEFDEHGMIQKHTQPDSKPEPTVNHVRILPDDSAERKKFPVYRGLLAYFPDALACVSRVSHEGNAQHHPDKPLHWDTSKSTDEPDAMLRHVLEGDRAKTAWRALAWLQRGLTDGSYKPEWSK